MHFYYYNPLYNTDFDNCNFYFTSCLGILSNAGLHKLPVTYINLYFHPKAERTQQTDSEQPKQTNTRSIVREN